MAGMSRMATGWGAGRPGPTGLGVARAGLGVARAGLGVAPLEPGRVTVLAERHDDRVVGRAVHGPRGQRRLVRGRRAGQGGVLPQARGRVEQPLDFLDLVHDHSSSGEAGMPVRLRRSLARARLSREATVP
jgi:hypothetical protein